MRFEYPNLAVYLLVPLFLGLFLMWAFHARARLAERLVKKENLSRIIPTYNPGARALKFILLILSVLLCVIAMMRPQYGYHMEEVKKKGLDIIIALDTSKSMLAEDIKPNRFERSKLAVKDMVSKLKGDRIGLVAFSGTAFLQCPLTVDYNGFMLSLDALNIGDIPRGGTAVSKAIYEAIDVFSKGEKKNKILIIITDGEDHEGDPLKAAEAAKKIGMVIYTIGIGTTEGELIPVTDENGKGMFLKDPAGNVVKSRLNEKVLEDIALTTGGSYIRSSAGEFGLEFLFNEKLSKFEKQEIASKMKRHYFDRFQIPLAIAVILLMAESLISDRARRNA